MDTKKVFALAMLIGPWMTVPFVEKKSFFRFLPVASFVNLLLSVLSPIGEEKKWWKNKNPIFPGSVNFSFILGPFFIATLWIFKLSYGNFPKYLITNIVLDFINTFLYIPIWKKVGVFKFKKMTYTIWYFISVFLAILIYGYQYIVEKAINKANNPQSEF